MTDIHDQENKEQETSSNEELSSPDTSEITQAAELATTPKAEEAVEAEIEALSGSEVAQVESETADNQSTEPLNAEVEPQAEAASEATDTHEESVAEAGEESAPEDEDEALEDDAAETELQAKEQEYHAMEIPQLLAEAPTLLESDDFKLADVFFEVAKPQIDPHSRQIVEASKAEYLKANGTEEGFEHEQDEQIAAFYTAFKAHKARKKAAFDKIKQDREANLKFKKELLEELKAISQDSEQANSVKKVKAIQEKWRATGSVPATDAEDLYKSFDALIKIFYDTKSIEYDLKELDRKKNLSVKLDLCEKAEALDQEENVNEAVKILNKLHDDFKAVGPVPKEEQENIWSRFKAASDKIYEKKRSFAEEFKKQLQANMIAKQGLCLQVETFVAFESDRIKEWNNKTKDLLKLQDEWNEIGPMPREVAKDINKQFWANFKTFFNNKNTFFEKLETERKENLAKKQEMVKRAQELMESTEWNETGDQLKNLQQEWKKIGPVPEKYRESVYQEFKAAIDAFFEKRRNRKVGREKEYSDNLQKKKEICTAIRELAKAEDNSFEKYLQLKDQYFELGFVPSQHISESLEDFVSSVEKYYENSELPETKEEDAIAKFHAEIAQRVPNADRILGQKEQTIRRRITAIENDIALWENNLAFFANSKTADKLKQEFEGKIKASSEKLNSLKKQLKIMRSINKSQ